MKDIDAIYNTKEIHSFDFTDFDHLPPKYVTFIHFHILKS